jgi:Uma2 family endonuclease
MRAASKRATAVSEREWIPSREGEWTIAQFMRLETPPGYRYEQVEGALHTSPSPGVPHQRAVINLLVKMNAFVTNRKLGGGLHFAA